MNQKEHIEYIKKFARENCLTQDEIGLFSKLVSELTDRFLHPK